jgi:hypothetical protein
LKHEAVDEELGIGANYETRLIAKPELGLANRPCFDAVAHVDWRFDFKNARARLARCRS